jgi:hypothetical protein
MKKIRKYKKKVALLMILMFLIDIINPNQLIALTSGPSQPEVESFQPISVSDMVDPFTGDFSYNIPLVDIDGYPINLSYSSGIGSDQESSWVGLGWNINPGAINRNMRGIPDEFDGDLIVTKQKMRPNRTIGLSVSGKIKDEIFGLQKEDKSESEKKTKDSLKFKLDLSVKGSISINFNNYNGFGIETSITPGITASKGAKLPFSGDIGISSGQNGLSISPTISYDKKFKDVKSQDKLTSSFSLGASFNSRSGLTSLTASISHDKRTKLMNGGKVSGSINFGLPTYTPTINMPMRNTNISFSYKGGTEFFGLFNDAIYNGYYSEQVLNIYNNTKSTPAYGYSNSHKRLGDFGVMDINRSMDNTFNQNTPNLAVTNFTFDMYSVSGQGISGTFRPYRTDFGYVSDNSASNISDGNSLGLEIGSGNTAKIGIDININSTFSEVGDWKADNNGNVSNFAATRFKFLGTQKGNPYEPVVYKQMGELSVDEEQYLYDQIGKDKPVKFVLSANGKRDFNVRAESTLENNESVKTNIDNTPYRTKRVKRNQVMSIIKFQDLAYKGLGGNEHPLYNGPKHHPAEISIIRNDGARYIYGIPAYNTLQEETSFNMGTKKVKEVSMQRAALDYKNGLIDYEFNNQNNSLGDNSLSNENGKDHYFESTIMPPFAHSYLLTAVLSTDYVDADNVRGPSNGDIGNYTLFKYIKSKQPYKWRTPYTNGAANYNEGLRSSFRDDKANYVYGEKEMWYLDKIETKNTIAIFTLENRIDGMETAGRNGGMGSQSMKLLRKISLYSKPEYITSGTNAVPIKEVHFEYDYSLCPNTENNKNYNNGLSENTGKLTLKKVYFTYGASKRSAFSPYSFDYTNLINPNFNPEYGIKNHDRWGNYKPNIGNYLDYSMNSEFINSDYPYVEQNKSIQDLYSSAWTLSKINLPSGGVIKIQTESDDYAYVQNKKAMQMFVIESTSNEENPTDPDDFFGNSFLREIKLNPFQDEDNLFLSFKLQEPIPNTSGAVDLFRHKYFYGIDNLYFKVLVDVDNTNTNFEYVNGWAEIESVGLKSHNDANGDYNYGYVKLKQVNIGDKNITEDVHPISKAAWHHARNYLPDLIYNQTDDETPGVQRFISKISDALFIKNLMQTVLGSNGYLKSQYYCSRIIPEKSFIRLLNPNGKKLGGGLRVKKIEISDEFSEMVSGNMTQSYGQEYDYTTIDESSNEVISSGVAAWEPGIGSDENPFSLPIWFGDKNEKLLLPDDKGFLVGPVGQEFYPTPTVGYSKVTVKNLSNENIVRHATGKVVNEFYTAKDFPTISTSTTIDVKPRRTNRLLKLFKINVRDFMTVSQGHSIELNDMHGKQKAMWVYQENNPEYISGVEYKYKSESIGNGTFKLKNEAQVVNKDGTTSTKMIGVEYDFVPDFREEKTETISAGCNNNLSTFLAGFIPGVVPSIWPTFNREFVRFRSATATKLVSRYGILEETIAHDLGSSVSTKNLAYDSETGLILLTQTKTNFRDDIYNFNYPAHWYYEGMGQSYKNLGFEFVNISFNTSGVASIPNASEIFVPGDELIADNKDLAWVKEVDGNNVTFINEMGNPFKPNSSANNLTIVRSGRRNLIGVSMGAITSLGNPLDGLNENSFNKVLNTNSQIFKDEWQTFCECFTNSNLKNTQNPYVIGQKGIWRAYQSFAFLVDRKHSWKNNNTNIREDGVYNSFNPFWKNVNGLWTQDLNNWTWTSEITLMNPYGAELENKDALNRYSAAVYGYNNTIPTAVGANSKYRELAFDGFEDYDFITCADDHFSFKVHKLSVVNGGHTGKKSISINSGSPKSIKKHLTICNP